MNKEEFETNKELLSVNRAKLIETLLENMKQVCDTMKDNTYCGEETRLTPFSHDRILKINTMYMDMYEMYQAELKKEDKNFGKEHALISFLNKFDTLILHSIYNQVDPIAPYSPMRTIVYEMGMLNFYLDVNKYEENKDILKKVNGLETVKDVAGYLEIINFINKQIFEYELFPKDEIEVSKVATEDIQEKQEQIQVSSTKNETITDDEGINYKV